MAVDGSDQVPRKGSGPGSNHESWNRMIRGSSGCFSDQAGYLDPCLAVEMAPLGSSRFIADGITQKLMTADGMHLTGDASELVVEALGKDGSAFAMPEGAMLPYSSGSPVSSVAAIMSSLARMR